MEHKKDAKIPWVATVIMIFLALASVPSIDRWFQSIQAPQHTSLPNELKLESEYKGPESKATIPHRQEDTTTLNLEGSGTSENVSPSNRIDGATENAAHNSSVASQETTGELQVKSLEEKRQVFKWKFGLRRGFLSSDVTNFEQDEINLRIANKIYSIRGVSLSTSHPPGLKSGDHVTLLTTRDSFIINGEAHKGIVFAGTEERLQPEGDRPLGEWIMLRGNNFELDISNVLISNVGIREGSIRFYNLPAEVHSDLEFELTVRWDSGGGVNELVDAKLTSAVTATFKEFTYRPAISSTITTWKGSRREAFTTNFNNGNYSVHSIIRTSETREIDMYEDWRQVDMKVSLTLF